VLITTTGKSEMRAAIIRKLGAPDAIEIADLQRPEPAAGVGPGDALIREDKSEIPQPLPLVLGSDLSGIVEATGPGNSDFKVGDEVYGVTNPKFTGASSEFAVASAAMVARKPSGLHFIEAASAPVVAVTAWQMLFEYAQATPGQTILIHGAAGNVGAYAVQLARHAGLHVIATASSRDAEFVK